MAMSGMPDIKGFKGLATSGNEALIDLGGAALINAVFGHVWGLVNEFGAPVLLSDNLLGISYTSASTIANAPIERGSFASYNKVASPAQAVVQMSKGSGGALGRGAWLAQLQTYEGSTLKFHVVSPEILHRNMSITGLDYARSAGEGLQLIVVNVQLEEVREVGVQYSLEEVKNPSDAENVDSGEVQPKKPNNSFLENVRRRIVGQ